MTTFHTNDNFSCILNDRTKLVEEKLDNQICENWAKLVPIRRFVFHYLRTFDFFCIYKCTKITLIMEDFVESKKPMNSKSSGMKLINPPNAKFLLSLNSANSSKVG